MTADADDATARRNRRLEDPAFRDYLDGLVRRYEQPAFLADDPVSIVHGFDDPRDQEVIGLFTALLAWGRRDTILKKLHDLCERMSYRPFAFVRDFRRHGLAARLDGFGHRTFRPDDAVGLTTALGVLLERHGSLERAFAAGMPRGALDVGPAIQRFSESVTVAHPDVPARLRKHLARPNAGSACKRMAMYLRWMVRPGPVDLGAWTAFSPSQLVLPVDIHAGRQARRLGLLIRRTDDWRAVQELTGVCRALDPSDPARYDFAFFGSGVGGNALDPAWIC